ncbi:MAG: type II secretion system F family protein [Terracidiphilus sp.]
MLLIIILAFIGVFAVVAIPWIASAVGPGQKAKEVQTRLASALATEAPEQHDVIVNLRKNDQISSIPWLNKRLLQFELTPYLRKTLDQANLSWSAGRLLILSAVSFAVPSYLVDLKTSMILPALGIGVLTGFGPYGFVLFKRSKRFGKFEAGLPEALDLMVSGLRAGHSLIAAMGLVGRECPDPVGGEFKACFEEQNYGLELKSAIENLIERVPLQDLRIVATAIMIQKESGGNLAEVLDKTSYVIRERFRLKRQVRTHTAQGRLTGWILSLLPVVLGIALFFVNPSMMSILWTRPIGVDLLWASVAMTILGGLVIRHIVNMDV